MVRPAHVGIISNGALTHSVLLLSSLGLELPQSLLPQVILTLLVESIVSFLAFAIFHHLNDLLRKIVQFRFILDLADGVKLGLLLPLHGLLIFLLKEALLISKEAVEVPCSVITASSSRFVDLWLESASIELIIGLLLLCSPKLVFLALLELILSPLEAVCPIVISGRVHSSVVVLLRHLFVFKIQNIYFNF